MANSKKTSINKAQDMAKSPKSPAKKMSSKKAAKTPMKISKSKKQDVPSTKEKDGMKSIARKTSPSNPDRKPADVVKNSTKKSSLKTRAAVKQASIDSMMADFKTDGRAKTALGMPVKDFSESAAALLMHYKVDNEKVLNTAACAM